MPVAVLLYGIIYPAAGLALISIILLVVRGQVQNRLLWIATTGGAIASVVRLVYLHWSGVLGVDYRIFYEAGHDILAGVSPYSPSRFASHPFLNPPSTFPFFAVIAVPPYQMSLAVWSFLNSVMALALVWQARRTLVVLFTINGGVRFGAPLGLSAVSRPTRKTRVRVWLPVLPGTFAEQRGQTSIGMVAALDCSVLRTTAVAARLLPSWRSRSGSTPSFG